MNKLSILSFVITLVVIAACRKDDLPELPASNSPIFRIEGDIDGNSYNFVAGETGVVLSSQKLVFNGVNQLQARLTNNDNFFELAFSSGNLDQPNLMPIDPYSIPNWELTGFPAEPVLVLGKQHFSNAENIQSLIWSVNGDTQPDELLIIYEPGIYEVCVEITFKNNKEARLCQEMILGYKKNARNHLRYLIGADNHIIAFFDNPEDGIERVTWYINDSLVPVDKLNLIIPVQQTRFTLTGIVENTNGTVRSKSIFIDRSGQNHYIEDLSSFENQNDLSWDNKARISLTQNGKSYFSTITSGQVEILEVEDFQLLGQQGVFKKIKALYSGKLHCKENNTLVDVNLTMTIALPEKIH